MSTRIRRGFRRAATVICRSSMRRPWWWLATSLVALAPLAAQLPRITLDTNLVRLLPAESPAAAWTARLAPVVGDGGYFLLLFEGSDRTALVRAVEEAASRAADLPAVRRVEYRHEQEFYDRFKFALIPSPWLLRISDQMARLEAQANPLVVDLLDEDRGDGATTDDTEGERLRRILRTYRNLPDYHESTDGMVFAVTVRPAIPMTDLRGMITLDGALKEIAGDVGRRHGLWAAARSSQATNLREFELIRSDLRRSGLLALAAIVVVLAVSFRSLLAVPFLLYPLLAGLTAAFGLVPALTGNLNTLTAFLLAVLFGLGIDSAVHLGGRFELELSRRRPFRALLITFRSTGPAVAVAGLTTALGFGVLTLSTMRGVREFGLIAGLAILLCLGANLLLMPACLAAGHRLGLFRPRSPSHRAGRAPGRWVNVTGVVLLAAAIVSVIAFLRFDFDFRRFRATLPELREVSARQDRVYVGSLSPAALYLAPDLGAVDELLAEIDHTAAIPGSTLSRTSSVRDLVPGPGEAHQRRELLEELRDQVAGAWVNRIDDAEWREVVEEFRSFPEDVVFPTLAELPGELLDRVTASDGSERFWIGIYPSVDRQHGRSAMRFTRELYSLNLPPDVAGPVGEMPVFAEILWTATREGPWLIALSLATVAAVLLISTRSPTRTLLILLPLLGAVLAALGGLAALGFKLNYFNTFLIAALLGIGIDFSVHFFRRWESLGMDAGACRSELLIPMAVCALTTGSGFAALIMAHHPGIRSIGILAVAGVASTFLATTVFFPGVLDNLRRRREHRGGGKL